MAQSISSPSGVWGEKARLTAWNESQADSVRVRSDLERKTQGFSNPA